MKIKAVAEFLGISPRRIQQLAREGMIPRHARGEYDLKEVVRGYIGYLKSQLEAFNGLPGLGDEGAELDCALVPANNPQFGLIPLTDERGHGGELKMTPEEWKAFGGWIDALQKKGGRRKK